MPGTVGDILRLVVKCQTAAGQQFANVLGFTIAAVPPGDPLATLASDWLANMATTYKAPLASTISLYELVAEDVVPGTAASYQLAVSPPQPGGATTDSLPLQDAVVATLRTSLKGRSYRGRIFFPPTGEGNQTGGNVAAGAITAYEAFLSAMYSRYITNATTSYFRWSVISEWANGARRATPIATPVASTIVRPFIRSQRRRQPGVGS